VQGNGGDIKWGFRFSQSMESDLEMYHQPRLSVATGTVSKGERYPLRNEHQNLLDNEWIYLMVMDPLNGNKNITSTKSQLILLEKK
jgi:uncharacterized protein YbcC (UPF0753/DUF2309 family)